MTLDELIAALTQVREDHLAGDDRVALVVDRRHVDVVSVEFYKGCPCCHRPCVLINEQ